MWKVPLRSTRWLAKRPRNKLPTVIETPLFYLLLHWSPPFICSYLIKGAFLFTLPGTETAVPPCMYPAVPHQPPPLPTPNPQVYVLSCSALFPNSLLYLQRMNIINTPLGPFHDGIFLHFILYVNYIVFVNVAQCFWHDVRYWKAALWRDLRVKSGQKLHFTAAALLLFSGGVVTLSGLSRPKRLTKTDS